MNQEAVVGVVRTERSPGGVPNLHLPNFRRPHHGGGQSQVIPAIIDHLPGRHSGGHRPHHHRG